MYIYIYRHSIIRKKKGGAGGWGVRDQSTVLKEAGTESGGRKERGRRVGLGIDCLRFWKFVSKSE